VGDGGGVVGGVRVGRGGWVGGSVVVVGFVGGSVVVVGVVRGGLLVGCVGGSVVVVAAVVVPAHKKCKRSRCNFLQTNFTNHSSKPLLIK